MDDGELVGMKNREREREREKKCLRIPFLQRISKNERIAWRETNVKTRDSMRDADMEAECIFLVDFSRPNRHVRYLKVEWPTRTSEIELEDALNFP